MCLFCWAGTRTAWMRCAVQLGIADPCVLTRVVLFTDLQALQLARGSQTTYGGAQISIIQPARCSRLERKDLTETPPGELDSMLQQHAYTTFSRLLSRHSTSSRRNAQVGAARTTSIPAATRPLRGLHQLGSHGRAFSSPWRRRLQQPVSRPTSCWLTDPRGVARARATRTVRELRLPPRSIARTRPLKAQQAAYRCHPRAGAEYTDRQSRLAVFIDLAAIATFPCSFGATLDDLEPGHQTGKRQIYRHLGGWW